jgi:hypothetical protein
VQTATRYEQGPTKSVPADGTWIEAELTEMLEAVWNPLQGRIAAHDAAGTRMADFAVRGD